MNNEVGGLGLAVIFTIIVIVWSVKGPRVVAWILVIGPTLAIFVIAVYTNGLAGIPLGILCSAFIFLLGRFKLRRLFAHKDNKHNQTELVSESKEFDNSVEGKS